MTTSLELYARLIGIKWKFQPIDGSIKRAPGCSDGSGANPTDRARPGVKHMVLTKIAKSPSLGAIITLSVKKEKGGLG